MKLIDISWPIAEAMTAYKDNRTVKLEPRKRFEKDAVRETLITLSSHTGTHVDAPAHFMRDGVTIDQIPLERLCGDAVVIDMTYVTEKITRADLVGLSIPENKIILFKTKNSSLDVTQPFTHDFVYIDYTAAEYLVEKRIRAIAIDYLGVERSQPRHETHIVFMQAGIPIIEGVRLAQVEVGSYKLFCLPLLIPGCDAAPARAVLVG